MRAAPINRWAFREAPRSSSHRHNYFEIGLVLRGTGELIHDDLQVPLVSGDLYVVDPAVFHELRSLDTRDLEVIAASFAIGGTPRSALPAEEVSLIEAFLRGHARAIPHQDAAKALFEAATHAESIGPFEVGSFLAEQMTRAVVLQLMAALVQDPSPPVGRSSPAAVSSRLDAAIRIIESRLADHVKVSEVAAAVGLSERTLVRLFRTRLGRTVTDEIQLRRAERAALLLMQPEYSVSEVGRLVGIPDPAQFSRTFRRVMGISPTQFRSDPGTGASMWRRALALRTEFARSSIDIKQDEMTDAARLRSGSPPRGQLAPLRARQADAFVDSIGVNVHMSYSPSNYRSACGESERWPAVTQVISDLGVRYIRDHLPEETVVEEQLLRLASEGIRMNAIIPPAWVRQMRPVRESLRRLATAHALVSIEGPNETDNPPRADFPQDSRSRQIDMWHVRATEPTLRDISVIGPSLVSAEGHRVLGDLSEHLDFGNLHPYPGPDPVTRGSLASFLVWSRDVSGTMPVQITEVGYTDPKHPRDEFGEMVGVTSRMAGVYIPKALLLSFTLGISRTYLYELLDEHLELAYFDGSEHESPFIRSLMSPGYHQGAYGLLAPDFAPKPAYIAIQSLISLFADPGPSFEPGELVCALDGQHVEHLLLRKRDGSWWLALWRDVVINPDERPDPSPSVVMLTLAERRHLAVHSIGPTGHRQEARFEEQLSISVPADDVVVVEIGG